MKTIQENIQKTKNKFLFMEMAYNSMNRAVCILKWRNELVIKVYPGINDIINKLDLRI